MHNVWNVLEFGVWKFWASLGLGLGFPGSGVTLYVTLYRTSNFISPRQFPGLTLIPHMSHSRCKGPCVVSVTFLFLVPTFAP